MRRIKADRAAAGQQYAIVVGLIAVVAILAITSAGSAVNQLMGRVAGSLGAPAALSLPAGTLSVAAITGGISPGACTAFPVTNKGVGAATDLNFDGFTGPDAGNFQACVLGNNDCSATLGKDTTCNFGVRLQASTTASFSATAQVSAGGVAVSRDVTSSASGFVAGLAMAGGTLTVASISGGSSPGACTDINVQNPGSATATGLSFTGFTGTNPGNFQTCTASTAPCGTSLASGANCNFGVQLTATVDGTFSANANVSATGGLSASRGVAGTSAGFPLYTFTSFTFTTCGATGMNGPLLAACRSAYAAATWTANNSNYNMSTQGIQLWTVPATGNYRILAKGAGGGSLTNGSSQPGTGASMQGEFALNKGQIIQIMVGQRGLNGGNVSGGGGGTFVVDQSNVPLIVAGGGGGAATPTTQTGITNASITTTANNGGNYAPGIGGTGGTNGAGGGAGRQNASANLYGSGGGGFNSNGANGVDTTSRGASFLSGGVGGDRCGLGNNEGIGGFGGGAGAQWCRNGGGGAGGGYSGGGGDAGNAAANDNNSGGGGGGSYNAGTNQINTVAGGGGVGSVLITKL